MNKDELAKITFESLQKEMLFTIDYIEKLVNNQNVTEYELSVRLLTLKIASEKILNLLKDKNKNNEFIEKLYLQTEKTIRSSLEPIGVYKNG